MFDNARAHQLYREQLVSRPLDDVFAFFAEADNLERITPPWLGFGLLTPKPVEMELGTRIEYRLRVHGIPLRWISRIERWEPGRAFEDVQVKGPYQLWRHRHEFRRAGDGTLVEAFRHAAVAQLLA